MQYINLRTQLYAQDKCGVSWRFLQTKALEYAKKLNVENFEASSGWLQKVLDRNNLTGIKLHGEAGDMTQEQHQKIMKEWEKDIWAPALQWLAEDGNDEHDLMDCIYNADQTGLYYQKLPNHIFVDKSKKKDIKGAKRKTDEGQDEDYLDGLYSCQWI